MNLFGVSSIFSYFCRIKCVIYEKHPFLTAWRCDSVVLKNKGIKFNVNNMPTPDLVVAEICVGKNL